MWQDRTLMPRRFHARALAILTIALVLVQPRAWSAAQQDVRGTVKDRSGAVVARAQVVLRADGEEFLRITQSDGTFIFSGVTAESGNVIVSASGFATSTTAWQAGQNDLAITLTLATVQQSLDVTATRTSILPTGVDDVEAQPDAVVVTIDAVGAMGRADHRRQAAPGAGLLAAAPLGQPDRESHFAGCVAARIGRQRRQPRARPGRWHSAQRSLRRLDLLGARAASVLG